jgi:hypothetical protein
MPHKQEPSRPYPSGSDVSLIMTSKDSEKDEVTTTGSIPVYFPSKKKTVKYSKEEDYNMGAKLALFLVEHGLSETDALKFCVEADDKSDDDVKKTADKMSGDMKDKDKKEEGWHT